MLVALVLGFACRVRLYLSDPSYWQDEAAVVLNVREKTARQLFGALRYDQATPPLLLVAERGIYRVLGGSELALRSLPFTCGILAMLLFVPLAGRVLARPWDCLAVLLFGTSDMLVWHANEVKQYGTDAFVAVLLLLIAVPPNRERTEHEAGEGQPPRIWRQFAALCVVSTGAFWFSYPAVFIFAAASLALLPALWEHGPRARLLWFVGNMLAGVSFLAVLWFPIRAQQNSALANYWQEHFLDWHHPLQWPWWLVRTLHALCNYPLQLAGPVILACLLLGCLGMVRLRRHSLLLMLAGPIVLTLLAAAAHRYPFDGARITTFLIPGVLLLAVSGLAFLERSDQRPVAAIAIALAALLLILSLYWTALRLASPRIRAHLRPIAHYVHDHSLPGDAIYVFQDHEWNCYWPANDPRVRYSMDRADRIRSRRFWIVWSFPNATGLRRLDPLLKWAKEFAVQRNQDIDKRGGAAFLFERTDDALPAALEPPSVATHHKGMHGGPRNEGM